MSMSAAVRDAVVEKLGTYGATSNDQSVEVKVEETHHSVKNYYGKVLAHTKDLKTNACTTDASPDARFKKALSNVHPDVLSSYYGCGIVDPRSLKGKRVLDLGCGTGRDVYVLAQFLGPNGLVAGVDMTEDQIAIARKYEDWHRKKFGYERANTQFVKGYIECLDNLGFEPASFDVVVSNCVINLSPDKEAVLRGVFKLLKEGGEIYFSDVYANKRVPKALQQHEVLWGECISGALYWNDFIRMAQRTGFKDPRLVKDSHISVANEKLKALVDGIEFYSATYRLFKINDLEPDCEDYGQAVIYNGGIDGCNAYFDLDNHHRMWKGKVFPVCGNTWHMLESSRFKPYFSFIGSFDKHFGIYEGCGRPIPFDSHKNTDSGGGSGGGGGCC